MEYDDYNSLVHKLCTYFGRSFDTEDVLSSFEDFEAITTATGRQALKRLKAREHEYPPSLADLKLECDNVMYGLGTKRKKKRGCGYCHRGFVAVKRYEETYKMEIEFHAHCKYCFPNWPGALDVMKDKRNYCHETGENNTVAPPKVRAKQFAELKKVMGWTF